MATQVKSPQISDSSILPSKMNVLTTKGDILVYDTAHNRLGVGSDGQVLTANSGQTTGLQWSNPSTRLLYCNTSVPSGNTIANNTSETAFASTYSIAGGFLSTGQVIRLTAAGVISVTLSPAILFRVKLGSTTLNASGNLVVSTGITNLGWRLQQDMIVTGTGSSGSVESHGICHMPSATLIILSNTGAVTVNTTTTANLQLSVTWGALSLSNTITLRSLIVEILS